MGDSGAQNPETNSSNNFTNVRDLSSGVAVDALPSATTNIVNDAEVVHGAINKHVFMDNGLASNAQTTTPQTIKSFLAKPFPVQQGVLSSSDNSSTFSAFDPIAGVLSNPIYKNKIDGHLAFRATTLVRLQVNAERFQQGRYILAFLPFNTSTYTAGSFFQKMHTVSKTTVTQLPHIEIDLACDTEAVLEIPYVSPASHYSILDSRFSVGTVFLYPYIPLTTGSSGSTSCEYTIWVSYKDVDLAGPTVHQSNFQFQMAKSQSTRRGALATEIEAGSAGAGPITNTLYQVSRAADVLSEIPLISAFTGTVSWASDIFARAASVFGWSNPIDLSHVGRMVQTIFPFANNADAVDESMPISLFSKNLVEPYSGFAGTDIDEMSIDFVKTIPAYIDTFNFTTSSTANSILYSKSLSPGIMYNTGNDGVNNYYVHTPVSFTANLFQYYRGSIKLTFKCAKTEFHSGRLLLAYAPYTVTAPSAPSLADTTYLHREIIDLRMGNEFSFVLPYASVVPYRDVESPFAAYGTCWLYVLNELVAPATVSSTVTFVVEVSAASDMEFAYPRPHTMENYAPAVIQSNFVFQMDSSMPNSCSIIDKNVGSSSLQDDGLSSSRLCVGEKIMSFLSLLKKSDTYSIASPINTNSLYLAPFASTVVTSTSTGDSGDNYSLFSALYGLSRGGVRIRIPMDPALNFNNNVTTYLFSNPYFVGNSPIFAGTTLYGFVTAHALKILQSVNFRSGAEVQVPQYLNFPVRVNTSATSYGASNYPFSLPTSVRNFLYFSVSGASPGFSQSTFERQASDDFQFGYFISTVPTTNYH